MASQDAIRDALDEFSKSPSVHVPTVLEDYFIRISKTGETLFPWSKLKPLFLKKLDKCIEKFSEEFPIEHTSPPGTNMDSRSFDEMKKSLFAGLQLFSSAPFTIQRLCEMVVDPKKHYKQTEKFLRGLEKNIQVVTTVDPYGNKIASESKVVLNGIDGDNGYSPRENLKPLPLRELPQQLPPTPPVIFPSTPWPCAIQGDSVSKGSPSTILRTNDGDKVPDEDGEKVFTTLQPSTTNTSTFTTNTSLSDYGTVLTPTLTEPPGSGDPAAVSKTLDKEMVDSTVPDQNVDESSEKADSSVGETPKELENDTAIHVDVSSTVQEDKNEQKTSVMSEGPCAGKVTVISWTHVASQSAEESPCSINDDDVDDGAPEAKRRKIEVESDTITDTAAVDTNEKPSESCVSGVTSSSEDVATLLPVLPHSIPQQAIGVEDTTPNTSSNENLESTSCDIISQSGEDLLMKDTVLRDLGTEPSRSLDEGEISQSDQTLSHDIVSHDIENQSGTDSTNSESLCS